MQNVTEQELLDVGKALGRSQAFGFVSTASAAIQAEHLREIRESGAYKIVGPWDTFCETEVGLSRQRVDGIIQSFEELGETYQKLRAIVRISPGMFRQIEPNINGENLEIDGKLIPILPENAPAIRDAVLQLRAKLRKAAADLAQAKAETKKAAGELDLLTSPEVASLQNRLDALASDFRRSWSRADPAALRGMIRYAIELFEAMEKSAN